MSYDTRDPCVTIRHCWEHKRTSTGRTSFTDKALPGVIFEIVIRATNNNNMTAVISKSLLDPVSATISIRAGNEEKKVVEIESWTDDRELCDLFPNFFPYVLVPLLYSVECEIKWYGVNEKIPTINLYKNVKQLLNTHELADFTIAVDEEEIPVHKVILAAQSPVFSAMFKTDMKESSNNRVVIKNIQFDIMKRVTAFLYTGVVDFELDVDVITSILSVAAQYEIMDLKIYCARILSMKLKVDNAMKIYEVANLYELSQLIQDTSKFIALNKCAVVNSRGFKDFFLRKPDLFLEFVIQSFGKTE